MVQDNEFGQPVGDDLGGWSSPPFPPATVLDGDHARLEPLDRVRHASPLFDIFANAPESLWTYLSFGPFTTVEQIGDAFDALNTLADYQPYAIITDGEPTGFCSYLRIDERGGSIEIGSIALSPRLQRTTAATEAMFLMIKNTFDLGYRRCEWKCDDLNAASGSAATRLGFSYEGTFKKVTHYKGRSRDTAWYAITEDEWPDLRAAFQSWLSPANFDGQGGQLRGLSEVVLEARRGARSTGAGSTA